VTDNIEIYGPQLSGSAFIGAMVPADERKFRGRIPRLSPGRAEVARVATEAGSHSLNRVESRAKARVDPRLDAITGILYGTLQRDHKV